MSFFVLVAILNSHITLYNYYYRVVQLNKVVHYILLRDVLLFSVSWYSDPNELLTLLLRWMYEDVFESAVTLVDYIKKHMRLDKDMTSC